jgi:hypothetical protein
VPEQLDDDAVLVAHVEVALHRDSVDTERHDD